MSPSPPSTRQHGRLRHPADWEVVDARGVGPFTSQTTYRLPDGSRYVWEARRHRKGRGPRVPSGQAADRADRAPQARIAGGGLWVWAPNRISWWVAIAFGVASALFVVGAAVSLWPGLVGGRPAAGAVNAATYWTGALVFTVSVYLWLLEGINASDSVGILPHEEPRQRFAWFAWQPRRLEFVAPLLFLVGSVLFNVETTVVVAEELGWARLPRVAGWTSLAGAVLFLVPSYLQLVEVSHRLASWQPRRISWWVVMLFIVGSAGFVVGAAVGFDVLGISPPQGGLLEKVGFLQGGVCYLVGSYLMVPELARE